MKSHRSLLGIVALAMSVGTCSGCLQEQLGQVVRSGSPALPTVAPSVSAGAFWLNGGKIHGIGYTPYLWFMPVSPAQSQEIEDCMERKEKDGVPILGPIKGEFAPIFCMDPPSEKDIYDTLAPVPHGVPFVYEVLRRNVRFNVEKLVDQIDECKFYPLAGPCQLHHCHFKCTVWWEEYRISAWPIPWSFTEHKQEVLYIDKDHLHRCGEPGNLTGAGGAIESYGGYAPAMMAPGLGVGVGAGAETSGCEAGEASCSRCKTGLRRAIHELF